MKKFKQIRDKMGLKKKNEEERPSGIGTLVRHKPIKALLNLSTALFHFISSNYEKNRKILDIK
jgi:hypothetical protein